jgi:hypothetical protein
MKGNWIIAGLFCMLTSLSMAQVNQGEDNDYTNNRKTTKPDKHNTAKAERKQVVKIIEYIPGIWKIDHVYKGSEDVTTTDTLAQNETIEFNREGRYISHSGTEKIDSGAYRINEDHAILYLASEDNEKPTEWYVSFDHDGLMTMRMKDASKQSEALRFVYRRNGLPTSSNR